MRPNTSSRCSHAATGWPAQHEGAFAAGLGAARGCLIDTSRHDPEKGRAHRKHSSNSPTDDIPQQALRAVGKADAGAEHGWWGGVGTDRTRTAATLASVQRKRVDLPVPGRSRPPDPSGHTLLSAPLDAGIRRIGYCPAPHVTISTKSAGRADTYRYEVHDCWHVLSSVHRPVSAAVCAWGCTSAQRVCFTSLAGVIV